MEIASLASATILAGRPSAAPRCRVRSSLEQAASGSSSSGGGSSGSGGGGASSVAFAADEPIDVHLLSCVLRVLMAVVIVSRRLHLCKEGPRLHFPGKGRREH